MKKFAAAALAAAIVFGMTSFTSVSAASETNAESGFVATNGNYFVLDGKLFYFQGANNYYLNYAPNYMIDDVLNDAAAMNLKVLRCWAFIDGKESAGCVMQPSLGVYDESGFERLDYTISEAAKRGIKLILPLVNNWDDFGGMNQYVSWAGASNHDDFYTNEICKTGYKNYIKYVLNRVNTYTGIAYKDDPTIMAWELGNEPRCQSDPTGDTLVNWADEMSTYIKSIDSKHLVTVGDEGFFNRGGSDYCYNGGSGVDWDRLIALPNIDFETMHLYPDLWGKSIDWCIQYINDHIDKAKEVGKPVILEEYGTHSNKIENYTKFNDAVYKNSELGEGAAGSMFWLLTGIGWDNSQPYPDYDGFDVKYPSDVASLITEYETKMEEKNGGSTPQNNSSLNPTTAYFDINDPQDISVEITYNGNALNGIYNGSTALVDGIDYTVSGDTVTILKDYLSKQDEGTLRLRFDFSAGSDPVLAIEISDTTPSPVPEGNIKVEMYNANTMAVTNSIMPRFRITNTGSSAISLSQLKIRYYFTEDGTQNQNFWCDWSTVGSSNVTGSFIKLDTVKDDADTCLEIGFTSSAGTLAPGASIEVQARFAKEDWSNYNQENDFSFSNANSGYSDYTKVAAYLGDSLIWGSEP